MTQNPNQPHAQRVVEVAVAMILHPPLLVPPTASPSSRPTPDILITQRLTNTPYAGYWEFPGGKIDPGEEPDAAAIREVREELGMQVNVVTVLPAVEHTYAHATVRLHGVVCGVAPSSPLPQNIHVAAHRWCAIDALPWDEFLPANVRLMTALSRWLHK